MKAQHAKKTLLQHALFLRQQEGFSMLKRKSFGMRSTYKPNFRLENELCLAMAG